ncbi:unnamed protein product [Bursaphelenchus okinawaensis]|uniref:MIF4G domain-containing protein n=1 Tax=Bursaphelenchus okinawaensis TaxID=465554 RepID=A0A811K689_9BILA|nr:unnamed protein product [Bursaphelenchus okinawaensis]CAG9092378.1 unnamed protein product [Bursaphelenchus okinawaensis]
MSGGEKRGSTREPDTEQREQRGGVPPLARRTKKKPRNLLIYICLWITDPFIPYLPTFSGYKIQPTVLQPDDPTAHSVRPTVRPARMSDRYSNYNQNLYNTNQTSVGPYGLQSNPMPYNEYYQNRLCMQSGPVIVQSMMNNYSAGLMNSGPRRLNPNAAEFHPRPRAAQMAYQAPQVPYGYQNYAAYMNPPESSSNVFVNTDRTPVNPQVRRFENGSSYNHTYNGYNNQVNLPNNLNSNYYMQNGLQNGQMAAQQPVPPPTQEFICQYPLTDELVERIQNSRNKKAIIEVQIGLEQLVADPHEYEIWSYAIKHRLSSGFPTDDIELVASVIVEMSYLCPNSQYNFSRLCKVLDGEFPNFTSRMIIPKVAAIMSDELNRMSAHQIGHFSIFIAELYDKTEVNGVRMSRLGQYLISLMRLLLEFDPVTDAIIKSVVQVLKLTGRYIEDDQDPALLNEVLDKLEFISRNSRSISESAKHNIRQLNSLREKQWGVQTEFDGYGDHSSAAPRSTEATVYGPDGQPISEEEWAFLEENCQDYTDSDSQDTIYYEQFMREQTEATAISAAEKALEKVTLDDSFGSNR